MTDLETMRAMLDRAGVAYTVAPNSGDTVDRGATLLTVEASLTAEHPRNIGYMGFMSVLGFDEGGALISWGCWE